MTPQVYVGFHWLANSRDFYNTFQNKKVSNPTIFCGSTGCLYEEVGFFSSVRSTSSENADYCSSGGERFARFF